METPYIKQRINELFNFLDHLKDAADADTIKGNDLVQDIKSSEDQKDKDNLTKEFKKVQFFNNMKLVEVEKTIPLLIELYKISQLMDIDLELNEVQQQMIDINLKRIIPMYIVDKNELVFVNKELEQIIDQELTKPSKTDGEAIKNVLGALVKDE